MKKRIYLRDYLPIRNGVPTVEIVKLGRGLRNAIPLTHDTVIEFESPTELLLVEARENGFRGWFSDLEAARIVAAINRLQRRKVK